MRLTALLAKAQIEYSGADREIGRIVCDSRRADTDTLFVCIAGFTSDGHDFAQRAYAAGCRAFLCARAVDLPSDATVILVENTRRALAAVSAAFYDFPAEKLKVIGITGTKGKTTTALMLASILEKNGISAGYIGSNGISYRGVTRETQNTTPESLELQECFAEMLRAGVQVVALEVSSQALYLDRVHGIPFFATAFTNLAEDHIGGAEHPTFAHYRDCKKSLFSAYNAEYAVFSATDDASAYMREGCKALCSNFGLGKGDLYAVDLQPFMEEGTLGIRFTAHTRSETERITLPMPGAFSVENALCAMALAMTLGVGLSASANALAYTYACGRFEIVRTGLPAVFVIDYAHNGFSLTSALSTLRAYAPQRLWCVTGSVGGRTKGRRRELGEAASRLADIAVLTADNPDSEPPLDICAEIRAAFVRDIPCACFADREEAIRYVVANAAAGDIVLLAGKGHEQYQLVRGAKIPFSERKLIEKYAMEIATELV